MVKQQDLDNLDTDRGASKRRGPIPPDQKERKQQRFLKAYRETANIKASCKAAGITRQTFYDWQRNDESFASQIPDADKDADDTLEMALYDRGVLGVPSYVVSQGRIVYEEVPVIDEVTRKPKIDDRGNVVTVRGKPLIERKYSDALLLARLKARIPEKYKDKQQVEHSGSIDVNGTRDSLLSKLADIKPMEDANAESSPT